LATKRLQQAENRIKVWVNDRLTQQFWTADRTERLRTFLRESGYRESSPSVVEKLFSADLAETHLLKK
jgi:hypothetical protein